MSFFEILRKYTNFHEMLFISVMRVIIISRQFFSTLVGLGPRSQDCDDELKISFLISFSEPIIFTYNVCPVCSVPRIPER